MERAFFSARDHRAFEMIDTADHHFIGFFVSPVIASIDAALSAKHYDSVAMIGLSGGGWTTAVTAAADERIENAVSVAGTLPFFARQYPHDLGDTEETDSRFYRRFEWPMLYQMAVTPTRAETSRFSLIPTIGVALMQLVPACLLSMQSSRLTVSR